MVNFPFSPFLINVHALILQDFSSLSWFLPFCFDGPAPTNSMVEKCHDVNETNVNELIKEFPVPYSHMKNFKTKLTDESKERIAGYEEKLDTILWLVKVFG